MLHVYVQAKAIQKLECHFTSENPCFKYFFVRAGANTEYSALKVDRCDAGREECVKVGEVGWD